MLGWFHAKPTCPVSAKDKAWIERRFSWLIDEFGMQRLTKGTVILPTTDFFPAEYHSTKEEIQAIMCHVAEYMDVDPSLLRLNFYEDFRPEIDGMWTEGSVGLYSESNRTFDIWLELHSL
ncbi:MAG: hypothetical protein KDA74_22775, partial [Planctomycetaceae bacterium]|nr:hypothetical protein [Planctomycetaceae bacterium]